MNIEEFYEKAKAIAGDLAIQVCQSVGVGYGYNWAIRIIEKGGCTELCGGDSAPTALQKFATLIAIRKHELHTRLESARADVARLEAEIAAQTKTQNQ